MNTRSGIVREPGRGKHGPCMRVASGATFQPRSRLIFLAVFSVSCSRLSATDEPRSLVIEPPLSRNWQCQRSVTRTLWPGLRFKMQLGVLVGLGISVNHTTRYHSPKYTARQSEPILSLWCHGTNHTYGLAGSICHKGAASDPSTSTLDRARASSRPQIGCRRRLERRSASAAGMLSEQLGPRSTSISVGSLCVCHAFASLLFSSARPRKSNVQPFELRDTACERWKELQLNVPQPWLWPAAANRARNIRTSPVNIGRVSHKHNIRFRPLTS
ncbi:hypothetical protein VTK26DRAFT_7244 [Humicola hyalothermophila]